MKHQTFVPLLLFFDVIAYLKIVKYYYEPNPRLDPNTRVLRFFKPENPVS